MESTANLIQIDLPGVPDSVARTVQAVAFDVASGKTLAHACKRAGVPLFAVMEWQRKYPEVAALLAFAREAWTHVQAGELMALPDSGMHPQMAALHANNIKFLLGKYNRKDYGEQAEQSPQIQGALVDALKEAIGRIPRPVHDLTRTIDMQPIEITGDNQPMSSDE